jgi:isoleucyl-tRNA synthetase
LSDLQKLIETARTAFESYDLMAFCLEAERFVDDKLSNWYIRRNRRRFWKSEQGADKLAAYQTLYTVLTTLTKLLAPVMPFLSETMWQNLKTPADLICVHLCDFPTADAKLADPQLSDDMESLLRLVSLGSAARNAVKIKVRQPLAELKVQPANDNDRRAVQRFADQIKEELNVKKVTLHDPASAPLLTQEVKANMKTLGPKFGPRLKDVQTAIAGAPAAALVAQVQSGQPFELLCSDGPATLDPADVIVTQKAPEGWAGVADRGTQVLIDSRITPELAREGMARDVVRQVQELRKTADLQMEDRIVLYLGTDDGELQKAIDEHRDTIAAETLTVQWATTAPDGAHRATVKIEGRTLEIALSKQA